MMGCHNSRPILCVEDSDEDFFALNYALRSTGLRNPIERCADGRQARRALASLEGCAVANRAALILLDLNLPGVHGSELLAELRRRDDAPRTPVIVLSTSAHERDIKRCYLEGANAYLVKPLALDGLVDMMATVVKFWLDLAEPPPPHQWAG